MTSTEFGASLFSVLDEIQVSEEIVANWQITTDLLAEIANVPAALIMRAHARDLEVFVASHSRGNVYHPGEKVLLNIGPYCEKVMSTRQKILVPNALKDPLWSRNPDLELGMISYCGLPLVWPNGEIFGTICVLDNRENAYNQRTYDLMERFSDSIQFGLANIYETSLARSRLAESEKKLRVNLLDSIEALASLVEMRDAYTAGHQRRTAQLAIAIAKELSLSAEQIEGLHLASVVHDVGKNGIPAEILAKPCKLSELEYGLIKEHPRKGYETLRNINFPWPISQIVLQHHERLDGSGYPQGLKGEEILLEAAILAVADVVEAMMSHRPYRAALGIDAALIEITHNQGRFYQPEVVAACLKIFHDQSFMFSS